ncbi:type I methionyl aminopeptidase [Paradevosia shaoguanensis]|uniref:Methionine aminopeptidase n=1 Tax=Paradevosia shaoguanensis TaxID=1335043 RepID=A0AA41QN71_9HYPH|nr:type I methionyl aminopeptidase [Paradevosia shaoguanensis]MCF1742426.1 type I methionyl aminopeptidase [Paradevosia shaoguanensis]MCI0126909.1 type I methionyl aminopeptidase [Paradevosia shaoguanensis]
MIVKTEDELDKLKAIGRICAQSLEAMAAALRPGITTQELDEIGAKVLADAGARSAPQVTYDFPGATCISVNEEVAHGIPGPRVIQPGDLVNLDVSAEKDGLFADMGASYAVAPVTKAIENLCRDGRKAMWTGIRAVQPGAPLADIGNAIGQFAAKNRYTLIRNLASHGIGYSLHDEPGEIPTWPDRSERRKISDGLVFTVEPFLSLGGRNAVEKDPNDEWTLVSEPRALTVQYEHTIVATKRGPIVVTLPG